MIDKFDNKEQPKNENFILSTLILLGTCVYLGLVPPLPEI